MSLSPLEVGKTFNSIAGRKVRFNHAFFYEYDNIVIRRLQELEIPFLDMRMLYSRTDAHPSSRLSVRMCRFDCDCLHFCVPGPLDALAILFLHFAVSQYV